MSEIHSRTRSTMRMRPWSFHAALLCMCILGSAALVQQVRGGQILRNRIYPSSPSGVYGSPCTDPEETNEVEEGACLSLDESRSLLRVSEGQFSSIVTCELREHSPRPIITVRGFEDRHCRIRSTQDVWPVTLATGDCQNSDGIGSKRIEWEECVPSIREDHCPIEGPCHPVSSSLPNHSLSACLLAGLLMVGLLPHLPL